MIHRNSSPLPELFTIANQTHDKSVIMQTKESQETEGRHLGHLLQQQDQVKQHIRVEESTL